MIKIDSAKKEFKLSGSSDTQQAEIATVIYHLAKNYAKSNKRSYVWAEAIVLGTIQQLLLQVPENGGSRE